MQLEQEVDLTPNATAATDGANASPGIRISKRASPAKTPANRQKTKKSRATRTLWETDGPDTSVSLMSVLLDWLSAEGNYMKWRGGDKDSGDTKSSLAAEISLLIRAKGVTHVRKPKDIVTKIGALEQSFRAACDFLANTGAGITNEVSLQQTIESYCPHYDILKGVMNDRAATRPALTTEDAAFRQEDSDEAGEETSVPPSPTPVAIRSIRPPRARTSNSVAAWADFDSAFSRIKALEQQEARDMHKETMELQREQIKQNVSFEGRRIACAEKELKFRVLLLEAQAEKERVQAQKEELLLKVELALCRKRLREEGIPEEAIEVLLPIRQS